MIRRIVFAYNPTGWDEKLSRPIPGGMTDVHIAPVLEHLQPEQYLRTSQPLAGDVVNVYYTHRRTYGVAQERGRLSVFAGHGIADKAWRNSDRMRDHFDWVVTSGPAWTHRLVAGGYPHERILEIGYPKLDPLFAGTVPSAWPARDGRIRVLWAPTHGGGGEAHRWATEPPSVAGARRTTWWSRQLVHDALPASEFHILEAPHPRHRADGRSTLGEYVGADVVIADGGSTIYEAWALGLPVVFLSWLTGPAHLERASRAPTHESDIYKHRIGRHADDVDDVARLVVDAARAGITDREARFVAPILPEHHRGHGGRLFADALETIVAGGTPLHQPAPMATFRAADGREVTIPATSPRADRYTRSRTWELVHAE